MFSAGITDSYPRFQGFCLTPSRIFFRAMSISRICPTLSHFSHFCQNVLWKLNFSFETPETPQEPPNSIRTVPTRFYYPNRHVRTFLEVLGATTGFWSRLHPLSGVGAVCSRIPSGNLEYQVGSSNTKRHSRIPDGLCGHGGGRTSQKWCWVDF